ncbi:hypothetical protein GS458_0435 [Geobacillus stearothermophilus]|nr:hypothetical protein GS458_0435 [Geobacillus stearothermophilus]
MDSGARPAVYVLCRQRAAAIKESGPKSRRVLGLLFFMRMADDALASAALLFIGRCAPPVL